MGWQDDPEVGATPRKSSGTGLMDIAASIGPPSMLPKAVEFAKPMVLNVTNLKRAAKAADQGGANAAS